MPRLPRFMGFRRGLNPPAEAIAQIADDARDAPAGQFGARQTRLCHNTDGQGYSLLDEPGVQAIRALPAPRGANRNGQAQVLPAAVSSRQGGPQ